MAVVLLVAGPGTGSVEARSADRTLASTPLEVTGSPGDLGDRPPFDHHAGASGGGVPVGWVLLGGAVGAVLMLGLVAIVGRGRGTDLQ